jgi:hypothetical protein
MGPFRKLLGLTVIAAAATSSGTAFTSTGLQLSGSGSAAAAQFLGGTVALQATNVMPGRTEFSFVSGGLDQPRINAVTLTFTGTEVGKAVAVATTGEWGSTSAPVPDHLTCDAIHEASGEYVSQCRPSPDSTPTPTGYLTGLSDLTVTVS